MKILAFAATNHLESINAKLIHYTLSIVKKDFKPDADIRFLDFSDYELPFYRQDREAEDGVPLKAQKLYQEISQADVLIVSFAEHNGNFSAVYKNTFDWMSRIDVKVYQNKPMLVMAASPGKGGGSNVLGIVEGGQSFYGMDIKAKVSVPSFQQHYDEETRTITNNDVVDDIKEGLKTLLG